MKTLKLYSSAGDFMEDKVCDFFIPLEGAKGGRALKDVVVAYMAALRQGNACTKNRSEVQGSGKKPWRQKGTGNARHGSRRSPIWVGGGVAHGPRPRDYSQKINKKVRQLAFHRALSDLVKKGGLSLIEEFRAEGIKTKPFNEAIGKISPNGSVLLIGDFGQNVALSGRNIERLHMIDADSVNALDLLSCDAVLVSLAAFERMSERVNPIKN